MSREYSVAELAQIATNARKKSIAPYSNYQVGAALLTKTGDLITAGNIESSTYGLTLCAERVTMFSALAWEHRDFVCMAIASENGATPCGACRQILWEFTPDLDIILVDKDMHTRETSIRQLFPSPFDDTSLNPGNV